MTEPVHAALADILAAYRAGFAQGQAAGAKLAKKKDLAAAFAPVAKLFKWASQERVVQGCLELPADHPLHRAAAALRADGTIDWVPWVTISPGGQPKRWTSALLVSKVAPLVYARENGPQVSVWSLETGAHVADLALPGKKRGVARALVELPDGTLRALTMDGVIAERAPSAPAFTAAHSLGSLRAGCAIDASLSWAVCAAEASRSPTEQLLTVHDVASRTSREITLPASGTCADAFVFTGGRAVVGARRPGRTEEDPEEHFLVSIDPATGSFETIDFDGEIGQAWSGAREGTVGISWTRSDPETGAYSSGWAEIELATRARTPLDPDAPRATPRYDKGEQLRDASGAVVGRYAHPGEPFNVVHAWDDTRNLIAIGGSDPEVPVVVVALYEPGRVVAAPAPAPEPLAWARPGTVLRYEIADFDAQDAYELEVLAADGALALAIRMDGAEVWPRARFTAAALDGASRFVSLAQGGVDVDVDAEHADVLPPIVVSRATAKKLASGKSAAFRSSWSEGSALEPSGRETSSVRVDGGERAVAVLRAGSDEVTLTVLDDPRWPLVIDRTEGDCFVRLVEIDTSRATDAPGATPVAAPAAAPSSASPSSGARRFELAEGSSAKFWEIAVEGPQLTVRFGKIGTSGQTQQKDLGSPEAAQKEADKLVREKTKKGYVAC